MEITTVVEVVWNFICAFWVGFPLLAYNVLILLIAIHSFRDKKAKQCGSSAWENNDATFCRVSSLIGSLVKILVYLDGTLLPIDEGSIPFQCHLLLLWMINDHHISNQPVCGSNPKIARDFGLETTGFPLIFLAKRQELSVHQKVSKPKRCLDVSGDSLNLCLPRPPGVPGN